MILLDAGPLVAILNRRDPDHAACMAVLDSLVVPFHTTWPVLTEAMHFVIRRGGPKHRQALWRLVRRGHVVPHELAATDMPRLQTLMETYADRPMDLADASLVVLAERLGIRRVFTLDDDFRVYRVSGRKHFEIVP